MTTTDPDAHAAYEARYAKQKQEELARRKTAQDQARAIAEHLDGWSIQAPDETNEHTANTRTTLVKTEHDGHPDCPPTFSLAYQDYEKRVSIRGDFPHLEYHNDSLPMEPKPPHVTISPTRAPKAAAADIARRFIPAYLDLWKKATDNHAESTARRTDQKTTAAAMAAITGDTPTLDGWSHEHRTGNTWNIRGRDAAGSGEATYYGEVDLKLRLSVDAARAVLQALADATTRTTD